MPTALQRPELREVLSFFRRFVPNWWCVSDLPILNQFKRNVVSNILWPHCRDAWRECALICATSRRCNRFRPRNVIQTCRRNDLSLDRSIDLSDDRSDDPGLFMRAATRFINSLDRLSASQPILLQTASVLSCYNRLIAPAVPCKITLLSRSDFLLNRNPPNVSRDWNYRFRNLPFDI